MKVVYMHGIGKHKKGDTADIDGVELSIALQLGFAKPADEDPVTEDPADEVFELKPEKKKRVANTNKGAE